MEQAGQLSLMSTELLGNKLKRIFFYDNGGLQKDPKMQRLRARYGGTGHRKDIAMKQKNSQQQDHTGTLRTDAEEH